MQMMLPMQNAQGEKFAFKWAPGHQQHAWIFYDNYGTWVTLRPAMPNEVQRAERMIEMEKMLRGIPTKG